MNKIIIILSIIILLLGGILSYSMLYKPYQEGIYMSGQEDMLNQIINVAGQCEQIPISIENGTITLIAAECLG